MYGSWLALCLGILLLFLAVLAWINFSETLSGKEKKDSMSEYLVVGKEITDQRAGRNKTENLFSLDEQSEVRTAPGVQDAGALTANKYPVSANIGGSLGFYTELFLESVEDHFLDVKPEDWHWQPGQNYLPVILSNDFLNMYNYGFALSQGYPQLSQKSIKNLPFEINIAGGRQRYRAQIVGFTDRISSLLVPQRFMEQMNNDFAQTNSSLPSRLILKVKDPSDKAFIDFLKEKSYTVNQEQLRWSRIRTAVQAIVTSVGAVALIVVGMALLSFILFVEITVFRSANNIRLMQQIGYAPRALRQILIKYFLPWIGSAVCVAIILTAGINFLMIRWLASMDIEISFWTAWPVFALAIILVLLLGVLLTRAVRRTINNI
jgi:hypothetical protein